MKRFIEQEANEKAEEILVKVSIQVHLPDVFLIIVKTNAQYTIFNFILIKSMFASGLFQ